MTIREDNFNFVLQCDDCSLETANTTIDLLMTSAALARWKVINDPDHGVQHICAMCGTKTEHELATLLRTGVRSHVQDERLLTAKPEEGFSLDLDSIVADQAATRGSNLMPNPDVVKRKVAEDGEFTFGFSLDDED